MPALPHFFIRAKMLALHDPLFLITSLVLLVLLLTKNKLRQNPNPSICPPKLPIIGNLHQLLASSLPHRSLSALSDKYGPLLLLKLGSCPTLVVSSAELAKVVLKDKDHIFMTRPALITPTALLYGGRDIAFAPYGEYWRQMRKVAVLHLLSNKRVQSYRTVRTEEMRLMLDKVAQLSSVGATVNLTEVLSTIARDIIVRVAVGEKCEGEKVGEMIKEAARLMGEFHFGDYFPWLGWVSELSGLNSRVKRAFERGNQFLDEVVERRMRRKTDGEDGGAPFADILISLQDDLNRSFPFDKENIKAIIEDTFGAGTDSTYITMEWIMAELVRNPNAMQKLKEEIKSIVGTKEIVSEEKIAEISYLKAVIKESFRLHPTGPLLVPRESVEETDINGYKIPKHARVLVNVWAIGRDPNLWEDPEKFWPERFIGRDIDFKGQDYELIPFGAGRRMCPGIQFAMSIVEVMVANLVHRFDWKLPCSMRGEEMDMNEEPGLTCRKKTNLQVIATPCY